MKIKLRPPLSALLIFSLFIFGCGLMTSTAAPPAATPTSPPAATAGPTATPADTPTPAASPTDTLTPTPSQPVFDPTALGDNRLLGSFTLSYKSRETGNGALTDYQDTINFIKEPFNASQLNVNNGLPFITSWIGDYRYTNSGDGHWTIGLASDADTSALLQDEADMRQNGEIGDVKSARFVEQKNLNGVPANHFEFDQTDLSGYGVVGDNGYKIEKAQGDLYLAQDGNDLLYYHLKETGNIHPNPTGAGYLPGTSEETETLSSINKVKPMVLPADYLALKLEPDLGLPLPAGSTFVNLDHYTPLQGGDIYSFKTSVNSAAFLLFYKTLAPTDGWTVTQMGKMHDYCGAGCAILKKGHAQIVLSLDDSGLSPWGLTIVGYYSK